MTAAALVALGACVALLGLLVVGVLRTHAEVLRRLHELGAGIEELDGEAPDAAPVTTAVDAPARRTPFPTAPGVAAPRPNGEGPTGRQAPAFVGLRLDGTQAVIDPAAADPAALATGTAGRTLLAFLTSGCGTCAGFWQAFRDGAATDLEASGTRLVVVTRGASAESPAALARLAPGQGVVVVQSDEAWDAYRVELTPFFVLVDAASGSVVGEGAAATWDQVGGLLTRALADVGIGADGEVFEARDAEEARIDRILLDAGIRPGDPSLHLRPDAPAPPTGR